MNLSSDMIEKTAVIETFPPDRVRKAHDWLVDDGITAAQLQQKTFSEIRWTVPGVIVEGSTLLGARPKVGKSWLLLGCACAVAEGGYVLGTQCEQGDVLGLFLEDNERRLNSRMQQMRGSEPWPRRVRFYTMADKWPRLDEGGIDRIERWIKAVERPRLVIVDTLVKVRPKADKNRSPYENDYNALRDLTELANKYRVAIVAVHHCRKSPSEDDPFDELSGTTGLTGAANTTLVIRRGQEQVDFLYGRGHDVVEFEKAISFNKTNGIWSMRGDAEQYLGTETERKILGVLGDSAAPLSPREVFENVDGIKRDTVKKRLQRMAKAGLVRKCEGGKYAVA